MQFFFIIRDPHQINPQSFNLLLLKKEKVLLVTDFNII